MRIAKLKINYYKSIKKPILLTGLPISILIGQNNCGKSNILYAIDYAFNKKDTSEALDYPKADIEIALNFSKEEQKQFNLPLSQGLLQLKNKQRQLIFGNKVLPYQGKLANYLAKTVKHLTSNDFHNLDQIKKDWQSLRKYPESLAEFQQNLAKHFPKIVTGKNALDINYETTGLQEADRKVTLDRLGSGFRRVFTILLYIFHPEYQLVIIDEPETHLHPILIKKLLWAMQNSSGAQIFFTTHSPLFIKAITLPQVIRVVKSEKSTEAFGLSLTKRHYFGQRLIQELDADNLEMFFADTVVLVEGVSDRILLRGLIDRYYGGDQEIKVVQTHGKGNMMLFIELLKIFNIRFLIVMDRDAVGWQLNNILNYLKIRPKSNNADQLIEELKLNHIFVLPNGAIEAHYPRKYQRDKHKPHNAIVASSAITDREFSSSLMQPLREIINSL